MVKARTGLCLALALFLSVSGALNIPAITPYETMVSPDTGRLIEVIPQSAIVELRDDATLSSLIPYLGEMGLTVSQGWDDWKMYVLRWSGSVAVQEMLSRIQRIPVLKYADPNIVVYPIATPNDPRYSQQTYLPQILAPEAWDVTVGVSAVTISINDSGVQTTHEDLAPKMASWGNDIVDFEANDNDPNPSSEAHGTGVAGIAGAASNNGLGVTGVAWNPLILPLKLGEGGFGMNAVIGALNYDANRPDVKVVNMSYGAYQPTNAERSAVERVFNAGKALVGGAGNNNSETPFYPCAYTRTEPDGSVTPLVICVAAVNSEAGSQDRKASYSNYGTWITISAPHAHTTTTIGGYTNGFGGTSSAAPVVSGAAALIFSLNPSYTPNQVRLILTQTADFIDNLNPGYEGKLGAGRLNLLRAVNLARGGGPDQIPPTVQITSPQDQQVVNGVVPIRVVANDNTAVLRVDIYKGSTLLVQDTLAPYEYDWDSSADAEGRYRIRAIAYDTSFNQAQDDVTVYIDRSPPNIIVTNPRANEFVRGAIAVNASATDATGVKRVEFYIDGSLRASLTQAPYQFTLDTTTLTDGPHRLRAVAVDVANNQSQILFDFMVDNTAPSLAIRQPSPGAQLSGVAQIGVDSTDFGSGLSSVELYINGSFRVSFPPPGPSFSYDWDTTTVIGLNHTIRVVSRDVVGNTTERTVEVQVRNDLTPPNILFSSPPAGYIVCGTVNVNAEVADNKGILRVDFSVGNGPITSVTAPPFRYQVVNPPNGSFQIVATAYDTTENSATAFLTLSGDTPSHTPPPFYPSQGPLTLSLVVNNSGVQAVTLFYRPINSGSAFIGQLPSSRIGNLHQFQIQPSGLAPTGIEYFFVVESPHYTCRVPQAEGTLYAISSPYEAEDVNLDGMVDERDLLDVMLRYGVLRGSPLYQPQYDPSRDGAIDGADITIIARRIFG